MVLSDLLAELSSIAGVQTYVSDRIFLRKPIQEPDDAYITINRTGKGRNDVRQGDSIRFLIFSDSLEVLETLSDLVILHFEGRTIINGKQYYKNIFYTQNDGAVKLENGFYYNMLDFDFLHTT